MPINLEWDNPDKTVLRMDVIGRWTWDEMYQASHEGYKMLDAVPHRVCSLIDFSASQGIPSNAITHARNMMGKQHPRTGLTVMVGVSPLFLSLWRVFVRVYALFSREQDFTFAGSLEEARAILAEDINHLANTLPLHPV